MIQLGQYVGIDFKDGKLMITGELPVVDLLQHISDSASNEVEKEILAVAIAALKGLNPAPAAV